MKWFLSFVLSRARLTTVGQMRVDFKSLVSWANATGHTNQCPTQEEFNRAIGSLPGNYSLEKLAESWRN
jgi:hypothetical protein